MVNSFTIQRSDMEKLRPCPEALVLFDMVAASQGTTTTITYPEGWTEAHSALLWQWKPQIMIGMLRHKVIPNHNIHRRMPMAYKGRVFV